MKDILLLVHDDSGREARIAAAVDLAVDLEGTLICLDPSVTRTRDAAPALPPDLRCLVDHRGVPAVVRTERGDTAGALARAAGLADIVVLNTRLCDLDVEGVIHTVLCATRSPVLAVPAASAGFRSGGDALLLWDGSRDAEAALVAAMPLLGRAGTITILQVDDGSTGASAVDAAAYLRRHGAGCHVIHRPTLGATAATVIERHLARRPPSYAVMGAFGHGRMHDALWGGVTRRLLARSGVPLLLAHQP